MVWSLLGWKREARLIRAIRSRIDIVMDYALGRSENRLLAPDFDPSFKEAGKQGSRSKTWSSG